MTNLAKARAAGVAVVKAAELIKELMSDPRAAADAVDAIRGLNFAADAVADIIDRIEKGGQHMEGSKRQPNK